MSVREGEAGLQSLVEFGELDGAEHVLYRTFSSDYSIQDRP